MPTAREISLSSEQSINLSNATIATKTYSIDTIEEFLKTPDCLFYFFTESNNWIVVRWETGLNLFKFRLPESNYMSG